MKVTISPVPGRMTSGGFRTFHLEDTKETSAEECPLLMYVRFEVFAALTMKNGVFWDVTPCGSCKNRRYGGT
jgi:hypothetical protein